MCLSPGGIDVIFGDGPVVRRVPNNYAIGLWTRDRQLAELEMLGVDYALRDVPQAELPRVRAARVPLWYVTADPRARAIYANFMPEMNRAGAVSRGDLAIQDGMACHVLLDGHHRVMGIEIPLDASIAAAMVARFA